MRVGRSGVRDGAAGRRWGPPGAGRRRVPRAAGPGRGRERGSGHAPERPRPARTRWWSCVALTAPTRVCRLRPWHPHRRGPPWRAVRQGRWRPGPAEVRPEDGGAVPPVREPEFRGSAWPVLAYGPVCCRVSCPGALSSSHAERRPVPKRPNCRERYARRGVSRPGAGRRGEHRAGGAAARRAWWRAGPGRRSVGRGPPEVRPARGARPPGLRRRLAPWAGRRGSKVWPGGPAESRGSRVEGWPGRWGAGWPVPGASPPGGRSSSRWRTRSPRSAHRGPCAAPRGRRSAVPGGRPRRTACSEEPEWWREWQGWRGHSDSGRERASSPWQTSRSGRPGSPGGCRGRSPHRRNRLPDRRGRAAASYDRSVRLSPFGRRPPCRRVRCPPYWWRASPPRC